MCYARDMIFVFYKQQGETLKEALIRARQEHSMPLDERMAYAGRLDPMAEGLLLLLSGEDCKEKDRYLGLDKEYEVKVLLGISSDTADALGIVMASMVPDELQVSGFKFKSLVGKRVQPYPAYSSKTVQGKPLFRWAREGKLGEIEIPERESEIKSVELLSQSTVSLETLKAEAARRIARVQGDFRQEACIASWSALQAPKECVVVQLRVASSSGAYMRTLAERLGKELGVSALAWSIKRTRLGEYTVAEPASPARRVV
jgi:tRNA pseudouridine(55) synthase